ncbi:hypothetical protein CLIB1444_05S02982 [[Candida] jaroonii]|uniref:Uncharacterized protein n=1 Tax=[Candida] jaroonii TaxID=467808 RepID=A0ACA9Y7T1_9ASCO|nr:hypothetical protein CLIB1444_05S02982 [[Candida] jaroonii]
MWKLRTDIVTYIPTIVSRRKIAAFDLDDTLITTKSKAKFPRNEKDWKFKYDVIPVFEKLVKDEYLIVIFTNQGGMTVTSKRFKNLQTKINDIISRVNGKLPEFDPFVLIAPKCGTTHMRKPQVGMWDHFKKVVEDVDMKESFFVGDAAGRKGDFSNSDLVFADNIGLKFYTPEEYFEEAEE